MNIDFIKETKTPFQYATQVIDKRRPCPYPVLYGCETWTMTKKMGKDQCMWNVDMEKDAKNITDGEED